MSQTFIPGKDAALEHSIQRFQHLLEQLGFNIEEASWLNPVPGVWSVHLRDRNCPQCFTNGKGSTKKAALASALGEFLERLSCNYFFADFYLGVNRANGDFVHYPDERWFPLAADDELPEGLLDRHLLELYQAEQPLAASQLIDLQSGNGQRGICALPFVRQSDGQTVYIPVNIIGNLYVSNGMSAGNSRAEARVQALSEILERHVKNRVLTQAISLPEIPAAVLHEHPESAAALESLATAGYPVQVYDASLGGRFPVVCVVLFNPANGTCFASFGAHPRFSVALERTVTELLQGRSLQQLDVFCPPSFDNDEVADYTNLETHFTDSSGVVAWDMFSLDADHPYSRWDFSGTTAREFDHLMDIFRHMDAEVYIADYCHLGVDACRILVPGVSEIYPVEDLHFANNNAGQPWFELLCQLPDTQAEAEEFLGLIEQLDEAGFADAMPVAEFLGLCIETDNPWGSLRIGELKAMLALAGGDFEQASDWVEWTLNFNSSTFADARLRHYQCVASLLDFQLHDIQRDWHNYAAAFTRLYGEQVVRDALAVVEGRSRFYGLDSIAANLSGLPAQQKLLAAYQKLDAAKTVSLD